MRVAHIVPPKYVSALKHHSYHLVVAPRLLEDEAYLNYWRHRGEMGAFIILDNGAVEEGLSHEASMVSNTEQLVKLGELIHASEIVMPDAFMRPADNLELAKLCSGWIPPRQCVVVPHGNSPEEIWDNLLGLLDITGCATIALPKHCDRFKVLVGVEHDGILHPTGPEITGRYYLCLQLVATPMCKECNVHLLGVWDNPYEEFQPIAKDFPWVRGCDSGIAAAYAQRDLDLLTYAGEHVGLKWNEPVNDRYLERNMLRLDEICH